MASWKARAARRRVRRQRLRVVGLVTGDLPIFGEERDGSGVVVAKGEIHPRSSDRGSWKSSVNDPRELREPIHGDRSRATEARLSMTGMPTIQLARDAPLTSQGRLGPDPRKRLTTGMKKGNGKSPLSKI